MSIKESARIAQSNNFMGLICRSSLLVCQFPTFARPLLTICALECCPCARGDDQRARPGAGGRYIRRDWPVRSKRCSGFCQCYGSGGVGVPDARRRQWRDESQRSAEIQRYDRHVSVYRITIHQKSQVSYTSRRITFDLMFLLSFFFARTKMTSSSSLMPFDVYDFASGQFTMGGSVSQRVEMSSLVFCTYDISR